MRPSAAIGAIFLLLLGACSSSDDGASPGRSSGAARPNIVFVLTDDFSSNLVAYMPHLKAMQAQGVTFSNYFVTNSLCCPSRASILTGRFPHSTGLFTNARPDGGFHVFHERGGENDTFATTLQRHGYRTALMGKYLNEYDPASTLGGQAPYVPPGWSEWGVAGNAYGEYDYILNENGRVVRYGHSPNAYLTDVISAKGVSFIDQSVAAGEPFLLELSTFAPHEPYVPAPRHRGLFPGLGVPRTGAFDKPVIDAPRWMAGFSALTERQIADADRDFRLRVQMVQAVDEMLATLQRGLRAKRQLDNTYIIFSSDNGFHIGEHRLSPGKMTAFDTDIRVPLVVVGPGVPVGRTVDHIVENIDLRPTFEDLAGLASAADIEGRSLVPFLRGATPADWRTAALVEHRGPLGDTRDPDRGAPVSGNPPSYEAMRTPTALYVEYADGEREYYDMTRDPDQLTNLAAQMPGDQMARLHSALIAMAECRGGEACWAAQHVDL